MKKLSILLALIMNIINVHGQNIEWAKLMGGSGLDVGNSITIDANGNVYSTGYFSDTADFDPGPGIYNLIATNGLNNLYVSKLDASGNFEWAKQIGGDSAVIPNSITVDNFGYIYIVGEFKGTADFNSDIGIFNLSSFGNTDIFITKLDSVGNWIWSRRIGGSSIDRANSVKVDNIGNVCFAGEFNGTVDFDPGIGVINLNSGLGQGVFISKLDFSGNFIWSKSIIGDSIANIRSIDIDSSGNIFSIGNFQGTYDFDPNLSIQNITSNGNSDVFLTKFDPLGNLLWAKKIGGSHSYGDYGSSIKVDKSGYIYYTGEFNGTVDFDPGAGIFNLNSGVGQGIYISKMDLFVSIHPSTLF